eukprot:gnl/Chilomastix_cuspidata/1024.p1 GENE.gnl/Chilomastix_cuspidata/1024~~gnl/Chilomastix_cuspidata/1024.p1  ORF type:complete len:709 (-),score=255.62 gnl/Chilomastix_cuspidata/1024:1325-3451(-)
MANSRKIRMESPSSGEMMEETVNYGSILDAKAARSIVGSGSEDNDDSMAVTANYGGILDQADYLAQEGTPDTTLGESMQPTANYGSIILPDQPRQDKELSDELSDDSMAPTANYGGVIISQDEPEPPEGEEIEQTAMYGSILPDKVSVGDQSMSVTANYGSLLEGSQRALSGSPSSQGPPESPAASGSPTASPGLRASMLSHEQSFRAPQPVLPKSPGLPVPATVRPPQVAYVLFNHIDSAIAPELDKATTVLSTVTRVLMPEINEAMARLRKLRSSVREEADAEDVGGRLEEARAKHQELTNELKRLRSEEDQIRERLRTSFASRMPATPQIQMAPGGLAKLKDRVTRAHPIEPKSEPELRAEREGEKRLRELAGEAGAALLPQLLSVSSHGAPTVGIAVTEGEPSARVPLLFISFIAGAQAAGSVVVAAPEVFGTFSMRCVAAIAATHGLRGDAPAVDGPQFVPLVPSMLPSFTRISDAVTALADHLATAPAEALPTVPELVFQVFDDVSAADFAACARRVLDEFRPVGRALASMLELTAVYSCEVGTRAPAPQAGLAQTLLRLGLEGGAADGPAPPADDAPLDDGYRFHARRSHLEDLALRVTAASEASRIEVVTVNLPAFESALQPSISVRAHAFARKYAKTAGTVENERKLHMIVHYALRTPVPSSEPTEIRLQNALSEHLTNNLSADPLAVLGGWLFEEIPN